MPCTCHNDKKNCKHCTECRDTHCRCLDCRAPLAVPLESPEDSHKHLVQAHDAHLQALAHLELALAALGGLPGGLPTGGLMDKIYQKTKDVRDAIKKNVSVLKDAAYEHSKKAISAVNRKILKPLVESKLGQKVANSNAVKRIANSRGAQAIASAGSAASNESRKAKEEEEAYKAEFEDEKKADAKRKEQKETEQQKREAEEAEQAAEEDNPYVTNPRPKRGIM